MESIHIIYPEDRMVSGIWIETMFSDAVANGDVDPPSSSEFPVDTIMGKALALCDAGIITLGRQ